MGLTGRSLLKNQNEKNEKIKFKGDILLELSVLMSFYNDSK